MITILASTPMHNIALLILSARRLLELTKKEWTEIACQCFYRYHYTCGIVLELYLYHYSYRPWCEWAYCKWSKCARSWSKVSWEISPVTCLSGKHGMGRAQANFSTSLSYNQSKCLYLWLTGLLVVWKKENNPRHVSKKSILFKQSWEEFQRNLH